ncbi:MAG: hypothetical protein WCT03_21675 [Candidatus Obscuribacterales bacterium]|jgi:hypothetical protein
MNGITDKIAEAATNLLDTLLNLLNPVGSGSAWDNYRKSRQVVLQPVRIEDERIFRA